MMMKKGQGQNVKEIFIYKMLNIKKGYLVNLYNIVFNNTSTCVLQKLVRADVLLCQ